MNPFRPQRVSRGNRKRVSVSRVSVQMVNHRTVSDPANSNRERDSNRGRRAADNRPMNDNRMKLSLVSVQRMDNNPASDSRGNLNRVSNRDNKDKRDSNRKTVNLSRGNRNTVNAVSEVVRDWRTAINPAEPGHRKGVRTANSRRSPVRISSTGPTDCVTSRKWWTIQNCEPKLLASAMKRARFVLR